MKNKKPLLVIEVKETYSRFLDKPPNSLVPHIRSVTSYIDEVATQAARAFNYRAAPVRKHLYLKRSNSFPTGLLKRVKRVLKESNYRIKIIDTRKKKEVSIERIDKVLGNLGFKPRNYQRRAVLKGIERPRGLLELATGAGKSVIISMLIACYDVPTLILTHRVELLHQLRETMERSTGQKVGIIGDGKWEPEKITVGLVNSLQNSLGNDDKDRRLSAFFKGVQYLIIDEAHHLGAKTWWKVAKSCSNTVARHGFSATMFRTDNSDLLLSAYLGQVFFRRDVSYMIRKGWLARPHIHIEKVEYLGPPPGTQWQRVNEKVLVQNRLRNKMGCDFINKHYEEGDQILVIISLIKHGDILKEMLINEYGVEPQDVKFMHGSMNKAVRKKVLEDYKLGLFPILIGSSIYDEGIDIPAIDAAANMSGGKSGIKTRQRLGRILRKKPPEDGGDIDRKKNQSVYYLDFYDDGHKFTRRASRERIEVYTSEEEFEVTGFTGRKSKR